MLFLCLHMALFFFFGLFLFVEYFPSNAVSLILRHFQIPWFICLFIHHLSFTIHPFIHPSIYKSILPFPLNFQTLLSFSVLFPALSCTWSEFSKVISNSMLLNLMDIFSPHLTWFWAIFESFNLFLKPLRVYSLVLVIPHLLVYLIPLIFGDSSLKLEFIRLSHKLSFL